MRINSSENLELLKQSYSWNISSQLLFFLFRLFLRWKRLFWPLLHIKPGKCLLLCPAHKQLPCKEKERSWTHAISSLWLRPGRAGTSCHQQSSPGKGFSKLHWNMGPYGIHWKSTGLRTGSRLHICKSYCRLQDMLQLERKQFINNTTLRKRKLQEVG